MSSSWWQGPLRKLTMRTYPLDEGEKVQPLEMPFSNKKTNLFLVSLFHISGDEQKKYKYLAPLWKIIFGKTWIYNQGTKKSQQKSIKAIIELQIWPNAILRFFLQLMRIKTIIGIGQSIRITPCLTFCSFSYLMESSWRSTTSCSLSCSRRESFSLLAVTCFINVWLFSVELDNEREWNTASV